MQDFSVSKIVNLLAYDLFTSLKRSTSCVVVWFVLSAFMSAYESFVGSFEASLVDVLLGKSYSSASLYFYSFLSHLLLWTRYGIWLYQFQVIDISFCFLNMNVAKRLNRRLQNFIKKFILLPLSIHIGCWIDDDISVTWHLPRYYTESLKRKLRLTVFFLSFRTDRFGQRVQSQIRSESTLFAIPFASFGCINIRKIHLVQLLGWLQQIFGCPKF